MSEKSVPAAPPVPPLSINQKNNESGEDSADQSAVLQALVKIFKSLKLKNLMLHEAFIFLELIMVFWFQ